MAEYGPAAAVSQLERWRAAALRALRRGRGVRWAADFTGLPLVFVYRVAAGER